MTTKVCGLSVQNAALDESQCGPYRICWRSPIELHTVDFRWINYRDRNSENLSRKTTQQKKKSQAEECGALPYDSKATRCAKGAGTAELHNTTSIVTKQTSVTTGVSDDLSSGGSCGTASRIPAGRCPPRITEENDQDRINTTWCITRLVHPKDAKSSRRAKPQLN